MFLVASIIFIGCEKDEEYDTSTTKQETVSKTQKVTSPSFDKDLTTVDTDGFSIRVRFKTGGDEKENLSAKVHWKAYSAKQSPIPSKKDLTKVESMRIYDATYHNTGPKKGMTESIVFDKSHAGYGGGTYIYYYVECKNSKGSAVSDVTYTIVRR